MNSAFATKPDFQVMSGILWGATNPTPGTGIAQAVQAAYSATAALAVLRNTDTRPGGSIIIPRYLRLLTTVAPASATSAQLVIAVDDINRYSSGGSAITASPSRSDLLKSTGVGTFHFGAVVAAAASADNKIIARKTLKNAIPVVGDEFLIIFGDPSDAVSQLLTGASAQVYPVVTDPVALIPGGAQAGGNGAHSLLFHLYYPANATTPASYEFEVGWVESPLW